MKTGEIDRNITCQLRYKGNNKVLEEGLKRWTGYIFKADIAAKLTIKKGANFFESFIEDETILKVCKGVDCFLKEANQHL